jgi:Protein of unknown function (DUF3011)/Ricin-type beta-trefoil lectin domain-like
MAALSRFSRTNQVALALIAILPVAIPVAQAQMPSGYFGPGRYKIENVASSKVLDVDLRDGRTVRQWDAAFGSDQLNPPNNIRNQQWDIEDAGGGFVRIKSAQTGMSLDVQQPNIREVVPVILAPPSNNQTQFWRIEDVGQGRVKITNRIGKSIDLPDSSLSNGKLFNVHPPNGGDNQKFLLFRIDGRGPDNDHRRDAEFRTRDNDFRSHDMDRREDHREGDFRDRDNEFRGWGESYMVYCPSDDMGRAWCPADARFGVRLIRQRSQAACIENQTWGYGKRGIWVDRGCRADFRVTGDWQSRAAALVYCPSDYMNRNFCAVDTRDGVFIVRQRSEADCVYNRTWGYDRDRIWVDRGCRADFEIVDRRDREWREWSRDWSDDDRRGWDRDHDRYRDRDRDDRDRDRNRDRDRDDYRDRPPYLN